MGKQSEVIMSNNDLYTRRFVVRLGVQLPVIGAATGLLEACGDSNTVWQCANPDEMSLSQSNLREASHYTESSPDPEKKCIDCAFFKAGAPMASGEIPNCGQCEIYVGPASSNGYCDSWSAITSGQS